MYVSAKIFCKPILRFGLQRVHFSLLFLHFFPTIAAAQMAKLLIVGPPGGGKGTLCEQIVNDYGLVHCSGGDMLREEVNKNTKLGNEVDAIMKAGGLVPDKLIVELMLNRMNQDDAKQKGVMLDGFPRTIAQARAVTEAGIKFDVMIILDVADEVLMERSAGRRLDPVTGHIYHLIHNPPPVAIIDRLVTRPDDQPAKQLMRIEIYKKERDALFSHFKDIALHIDGNQEMEDVFENFTVQVQKRGVVLRPINKQAKPAKL
jgi:adenylate kinase